ncbi:hypothetical protein HPB51_022230 [Rhipicephalus microplus]|uniref:Uncharacterized protein n=1 Tax=Rhipicephalus microplus TaxID=6941 RepID=A0A9J6E3X0_RHIMP|nr:hypothetical protein HPB51_022230 [Rhipicephalus microplus]
MTLTRPGSSPRSWPHRTSAVISVILACYVLHCACPFNMASPGVLVFSSVIILDSMLAENKATRRAGDEASTVEAVCIDGAQRTLAAGLLSGRLSLWDLGSQAERQSCLHPEGVTRAFWQGPHTVVTGCLDGAVRSWDVRTPQEPALCWRAHRHDILDLVLCPDGQRVVSVSDDGICAVHRFASPD